MTRLGITTRARAAASSITLMIIGSAFVLVGVLTLEHVAVVILGLASLVTAGIIGARAETMGVDGAPIDASVAAAAA